MRRLIVNADDFGQSPGVNKGIIECFENGILTSASLMVHYAAATEAAAYAKQNPSLGVGLHVDLGEWFYSNGEWLPRYEVVSLDNATAVEAELRRQCKVFYRLMNRKPTHIDSHQHVHLREDLRHVFLAFAKELDVPLRRCGNEVNYCGDFYGQSFDGSPYHQAIGTEGLRNILSRLANGLTEMACHPGLGDDVETMYRLEREIEVRSLCNETIREFIRENCIELCSFEGLSFCNKPASDKLLITC